MRYELTMRNLLTPTGAFSPWFQDVDEALDRVLTNQKTSEQQKIDFSPACEVSENDTHYVMSFDLPGIPKEDVKIEVLDKQLTISGERKSTARDEKDAFHLRERFYGTFKRVFTLPTAIAAAKVEARFKDGVLQIAVPKAEEVKPQQIAIADAGSEMKEVNQVS